MIRAESQPRKRDATAAGVQGATWGTGGGVPETPPPRVAEENLEGPTLHGAPPGNVVVPSLGGGIPT